MNANDEPTRTSGGGASDRPTGSVAGSGAELPVEQALLLDEACNAFEAKWRGGGRPDIAAAVLGLPEAVRPAGIKELVALDVFYWRKGGETPTAAEYTGRFPDLDPDWVAGVVAGTESPSAGETVAPPTPRVVEGIGTVIAGKYTLVEVIGEGGMGSVYRARQSQPVKRDVALKLIKGGLDSQAVLARFGAERQALALMDHPNIARVYDGGTTEKGQPFFVMELVKGVPITQFCDQRRLPISARLELFVLVCQAVQHAHQKGIIHRDLKPSNVLVTEVDGRATPKVIDFGVAKATEQRLTELSLGDTGAIVGTPAYMSPEQADPSSTDIDTRTDVYALGVMLYELLTGSPPIDSKQFKRGAIFEMLRVVREVEPPRASTKLSTADDLPNIAANRDIEPGRLAKLLRGELDWVVMKALEKDRARRYDTANGLARDIQRYLADEVVEARPPSAGYRMKKFVRRHKGQVIAATLILLTLIGGIVGTSLAMVEARREAERADKQADKATLEAKRADREAADARNAESRAKDSEAQAKDSARLAKWNERLARDVNHAIKLGLALGADPMRDRGLVRELLDETHADYGRTFENRFVRAIWLRGTVPVQSFLGHANFVTGAALSPDGRHVATSSWDRTARVWSAETGNEIRALTGHTNFVTGVAYSPDGTRILTGSWDRTARVWDAETGKELLALTGHAHYVLCAAYSRDGKRIVTASYDGTARVWDAQTGEQLLALTGHAGPVWGAAFGPDRTRVVTAGDSAARIWDAQTGKELLTLTGYPEPITTAAFNPDGARVVTAGHDRTARVWDATSGAALLALRGHTSGIASVSYSPDGTRIVTGGHDGTVRVWEADRGVEKLNLTRHTNAVSSAAFSRDGTRLVTGSWDQTARVWSTDPITEKHVLLGHTTAITCAAYSPDGTRVATGATADDKLGEVKVWDAATGTPLFTLKKFSEPVLDVAYSPDGTRLLTIGGGYDKYPEVKVWDAATGEEKLAFRVPDTNCSNAAFSPDGTRIVTSGWQKKQFWDAATGAEIVPKGGVGSIRDVAFAADGKRTLVCGADSNTPAGFKVWEAETGKKLFTLWATAPGVRSATFSSDGKRLLTDTGEENRGREVRVWDVETGKVLAAVTGSQLGSVYSVCFTPDGRSIVATLPGLSVQLWDAVTGRERLRVQVGERWAFGAVRFSADGKRFVTTGRAGTANSPPDVVKVWDTETGALVCTFSGTEGAECVLLSRDGTHLVTSDGKVARVWEVPSPKAALPRPDPK